MRLLPARLNQENTAYKRWREHLRAILDFNRSLILIADPSALMASVAERLRELFGADRLIFLRATAESNVFTSAYSLGYEPEQLKSITLTRRGRLAKWLLTNETALVVPDNSEVYGYLSEPERLMLDQLDVRVFVPLLALNHLTGIMILSSTRSDWRMSPEDLNLVMMLAIQASLAFENAYMLEEQRERLRKLYRAERLATAGQLAASVAHEIRNPLTAIRSTVQYLVKEFEPGQPKRALIEGVISEVDRINRTVDGLLSLTRRTEFTPERLDIAQLVHQLLLLLQTQAQHQAVEMIWPQPSAGLFVMGDVSQLKQLFLNLLLNALQALENGGQLRIEFKTKSDLSGTETHKPWLQVSITDSGCGIPPENLEKIFDPFFTTKPGGTGLGLPTAHAIVRQHASELEISSSVGEGTRVTVQLPLIN